MAQYKIDRGLLESYSTEEIKRILKEEKDDYTPEAIKIFEEILRERGVVQLSEEKLMQKSGRESSEMRLSGDAFIHSPDDAVNVLNSILIGVLDGKIDPRVAEAATNVVMGILRALEQQFMQSTGEE